MRILFVVGLLVLCGCADSVTEPEGSGVGDSCRPETAGVGLRGDRVFLETNSVQCETRVCMAYYFDGDPTVAAEEDPTCTDCPTIEEIEERVYCTCRCSLVDDRSGPVCTCPEGFFCEELSGFGLRGNGYCVKPITM